MFIILNGPLGIGKSTLAEALTESIDQCVLLSGDALLALNPAPPNELAHLHSTLALLVRHNRSLGYRNFVIEHIWRSPAELNDLQDRLAGIDREATIHCFLLTLPVEANIDRIERRQSARVLDEREFELRTVAAERDILTKQAGLGTPFDVSAAPPELVAALLRRIG